jgi:hypothetical protein
LSNDDKKCEEKFPVFIIFGQVHGGSWMLLTHV